MTEIPASGFSVDPLSFIEGKNNKQAQVDLSNYLDSYTGSRFEMLSGGDPNVIGPENLLALTMLSLNPPRNFSVWVLEDGRSQIVDLLSQIPHTPIWEVEASMVTDPTRPLVKLRRLLQKRTSQWQRTGKGNKIGFTKATKLLAGKRPALVPIYDSVVARELEYPKDDTYWERWRVALARADAPQAVESLRAQVGVQRPQVTDLSVLRVLDIAIWMEGKRNA